MGIRIINKRDNYNIRSTEIEFYVGRPSPLGNPFKVNKDGNRDEVCDKYEKWLQRKIDDNDSKIIEALNRINEAVLNNYNVVLVCWCVPKRCHAETIVKVIKNGYKH